VVDSLLPAVKKFASPGLIPARVLVVDPEPLTRWSICVALSAAGFDADSAATAEEAHEMLALGDSPRVVLLDVHPDRQPQPLIDQIHAGSPGSRFLVMSTARQTTEMLRQLRGVQVVEKPFDLAQLVSVVTELAGDRAAAAGDRR
jgi:two-component system, OmpR family, KDP operon response regulator KdpE